MLLSNVECRPEHDKDHEKGAKDEFCCNSGNQRSRPSVTAKFKFLLCERLRQKI